MFLITSAAYVETELQVELGRLPPAFLPIANRRLFEYQIRNIRSNNISADIYMSVPATYEISPKDLRLIEKLNINVIFTPDGLSLGESVLFCIESCDADGGVSILHGDTLVKNMLFDEANVIALAESNDEYRWMYDQPDKSLIWCGFFKFEDKHELAKSIISSGFDFVGAIKQYAVKYPVKTYELKYWLDFGHVNTYYKSRCSMTSEREFNELKIHNNIVSKSSSNSGKIESEAFWFETVPPDIKRYCPQLIENGFKTKSGAFYSLEYMYLMPLNELYVHGKHGEVYWKNVFISCREYIEECQKHLLQNVDIERIRKSFLALIEEKTRERIQDYFSDKDFNFNHKLKYAGEDIPSLNQIIDECVEKIKKVKPVYGVLHGDFCFSNIMFDTRSKSIKVIDPRGQDYYGDKTIYGDLRYDLAKLYHSVIGYYDYIVSESYSLMMSDIYTYEIDIYKSDDNVSIEKIFIEIIEVKGLCKRDIMPIVILLFLSMIPLHNENERRQNAFFANALRLYVDYIKGDK